LSQEQEETKKLSKKERLELAANDMDEVIGFKDRLEIHQEYIRMSWNNGTYTIISIKKTPNLINDGQNFEIKTTFIATDHKAI